MSMPDPRHSAASVPLTTPPAPQWGGEAPSVIDPGLIAKLGNAFLNASPGQTVDPQALANFAITQERPPAPPTSVPGAIGAAAAAPGTSVPGALATAPFAAGLPGHPTQFGGAPPTVIDNTGRHIPAAGLATGATGIPAGAAGAPLLAAGLPRPIAGKRPGDASGISRRSGTARPAAQSRPSDIPGADHPPLGIFSRRIFAQFNPGTGSRSALFPRRNGDGRGSRPAFRARRRAARSFNRTKPGFPAKLPVRGRPPAASARRRLGVSVNTLAFRIFARIGARNSGDPRRDALFPQ